MPPWAEIHKLVLIFTNSSTRHIRLRTIPVKFVVRLMAAAAMAGCANPDSPVGGNLDDEAGGVPEVITVSVDTAYSYTSSPVRTGGSVYVYAGSAYGITAHGLFKFNRPMLGEGVEWDSTRSAVVQLRHRDGFGEDQAVRGLSGRLVRLRWGEGDSLTAGAADSAEAVAELGALDVAGDSGSAALLLPKEVVQAFLAAPDTSAGAPDSALTLWIQPAPSSRYLTRFFSRNAPEDSVSGPVRPRIYLPVTMIDTLGNRVADTIEVYATADLFVVEYADTSMAGELRVGSGVPWRTLLRFDLREFWARSDSAVTAVNRATVTLFVQPGGESWPRTRAIWPMRLTTLGWLSSPDSAGFSVYTNTITALAEDADSVRFLVTAPTQDWVKGADLNYGVMVTSGGVGLDLDRVAFYGAGAPDPSKRPKLTVYYTRVGR